MIQKISESRGWQLFFAAVLIFVVPVMVDVNERLSTIRHMREQQAHLEQEYAAALAEQRALQAQLEYVNSDAYVERWARVEARMTLPGEVSIIPLFDGRPLSSQTASEEAAFPPDISPSAPEQRHDLSINETTTP